MEPQNSSNPMQPVPPEVPLTPNPEPLAAAPIQQQPIPVSPVAPSQPTPVAQVVPQAPAAMPGQTVNQAVPPPQPVPPAAVMPPQMPGPHPEAATPTAVAPTAAQPAGASSLIVSKLHKFEKPMAIIVTALIAIVSLANVVGVFHVLSVRHKAYEDLAWVKNENENAKFGPEIEDRSDGKLDMSKKIDIAHTGKAQDLKIKLKQQANLTDGYSMMVTAVDKNWKPNGKYLTPKKGNVFMSLAVIEGNRATKSRPGYLTIEVILADGTKLASPQAYPLDSDLHDGESVFNDFNQGDYDPGEVRKGNVFLNVPPTASKVIFEDKYWGQDVRAENHGYATKTIPVTQKIVVDISK